MIVGYRVDKIPTQKYFLNKKFIEAKRNLINSL